MTLEIILFCILGFQCVFASLNVLFFPSLRSTRKFKPTVSLPKVSILIPARDEAQNLQVLLSSLLLQNDLNFEVIVLDDHSSDTTLSIVRDFAQKDSRVLPARSLPLPSGWLGKNFACFQLSKLASGEILIFTDADTIWAADGVRLVRQAFEHSKCDALSAWPEQRCLDWLSRLIQPLQQWSLITFLPMLFVPVQTFPVAVAATGQLIAFKKSFYQAFGGHSAVQNSVIEDMSLARLVKRRGGKFILLNAAGVVQTTMYSSVSQTLAGYAKNAFSAFGANIFATLATLVFHIFVYLTPWFLLLLAPKLETLSLVVLSLYPRVLADFVSRYDLRLSILHPISIVAWTYICLQSTVWYFTGQTRWKGRKFDLRLSSEPILEPERVVKKPQS